MRRTYARFRRLLAATLAAAAVLVLARIVAPPPPEVVPVVVAARDLAGGSALAPDDVRLVDMPPALAPAGSFAETVSVVGNRVAAPMRAGEPLTDRRVLGRALLLGYPAGLVAAPVRIQDSDVVSLLRAGDSIDVYAVSNATRPATRIVSAAPVVMLPQLVDGRSGALVVLAVTPVDAAEIAAASAIAPLSVTLRG